MSTKPKWAELSDIQRQSWTLVGPFLAVHFIANIALLAIYALGLTNAVIGNSACFAIETLNPGVTNLHRAFGGSESLGRICQLYVPTCLVNIVFAAFLGIVVILARGTRAIGSRYFLLLLAIALIPLGSLAFDPLSAATKTISRSIRSGSFGAYIVFLIGSPLLTSMAAAFFFQKIPRNS
jgi:hypothetical protein